MPPAQKDTGPVDATGLELRRVRDRGMSAELLIYTHFSYGYMLTQNKTELELKRLSGDISCAECRRFVRSRDFTCLLLTLPRTDSSSSVTKRCHVLPVSVGAVSKYVQQVRVARS